MDKGLGLAAIADAFEVAGAFVDIVKLGWGTAYVTANLERKLALYRSLEVPVTTGGTFFELAVAQGRLDGFKRWLADLGFTDVEVSDGTIDLPRDRKLELIEDLARDFRVVSEVGSKDESVEYTPRQWSEWIREELEAGAWKVIAEGREGGTAGIFGGGGDLRGDVIDEIAADVDLGAVFFDAPTKESQVELVRQFGPHVNLSNIPVGEVIPLETLRLGLRSDTLGRFLTSDAHAAPGAS